MASESTALTSDPAAAGKTEPPTPSEYSSRRSDRRIPSARETLATLPEIEDGFDFEPHDTIPAPPWLEELEDKISPPHKAP